MRYKRAVEKLRILAETCERVKIFWSGTEPFPEGRVCLR